MQVSAPLSCFHAIDSHPMAFFHTRTCPCFKTISIRIRKPLFFPHRLLQAGGHGCFPVKHIREEKRKLFSSKATLFIFTEGRYRRGQFSVLKRPVITSSYLRRSVRSGAKCFDPSFCPGSPGSGGRPPDGNVPQHCATVTCRFTQ